MTSPLIETVAKECGFPTPQVTAPAPTAHDTAAPAPTARDTAARDAAEPEGVDSEAKEIERLAAVVRDGLTAKLRNPQRLQVALKPRSSEPELVTASRWLAQLRRVDLSAFGLEEPRRNLVEAVQRRHRALLGAARAELVTELARLSGNNLVELSREPLELLLEPFSVTIDMAHDRATVKYAREVLHGCRATPEAIWAACVAAARTFAAASVPTAVFWPRLATAWELVRLARTTDDGPPERVDLVDLLGPLALLSSDRERWRCGEIVSVYPRYLLAHQLARLRADGALTHRGQRLDLGSATGGSTRRKKDVLFVPSDPSGRSPNAGQYYLSVRLVPAAQGGA